MHRLIKWLLSSKPVYIHAMKTLKTHETEAQKCNKEKEELAWLSLNPVEPESHPASI